MKIDTTKIEGYADMTAEEKLAALEAYDVDTTGLVRKDLLDKAASEAAAYKKQLREKLSADEQAEAERQEALKSMQAELETLRAEKAVEAATKKWMGLGYSEQLATETAKAMGSGDTQKGRRLAMMTTGIDTTRILAGIGMSRNNQAVHFTQNQYFGTGTTSVHIGDKAGNIARHRQLIAKRAELFLQIF